jgi:DNA-binding GntR family transcriptional regulator
MKDRSSGASDLAGEAYVIIRERILRGEVAIGQVISRRKIAAELGMSFLPVSEAFLRLEFEGLLESRPRAGTRVRIPSRAATIWCARRWKWRLPACSPKWRLPRNVPSC